ncbi:XkdF-like putative serine protease domain-containing protein [Pedobacter aquatilis]|uniref:XkdF-like putative serine protease domain-containing protein n=1 Tax=Pedobacter aquatilis TaxID=351343 RepID=UPI0029308D12|nr:XkdF-like putative serine protease domain-containing protein [Pedobacter aquatilis]
MIKKLPLIELKINPEDESFVSAISLVEAPAVESQFIAFSQDKDVHQFNLNDEKRELIGIAMKANVPIYRKDAKFGEYAVVFSADTIRQIAQTFFQKNFSKSLNIEHSSIDAESFVFQSYIVDFDKGMLAPKGIDDAGNGDWIVGVKVLSNSVWSDIKSGKQKGFSVEGIFSSLDLEKEIDFQFQNKEHDLLTELEALLDAFILANNL